MAAKHLLGLFILGLCATACSWEYHRSHYETPFYNPQPGEFYSVADSIKSANHGHCQRTEYYIKKGNWRHMSACYCLDGWKVDSAFDKKGRLYLVNSNRVANSNSYLYDSSATLYFDRKERLLKRYISIYKPDTTYEYWQYFDESGKAEERRRPVIYTVE